MKCGEAGRYLAELSVGGLGWLKRMAVRRHLRRCASCRSELARLEHVDAILREDLRAPAAPADLWDGVRTRLADRSEPQPARRGFVRATAWSLGAATAAVLLVALLLHTRMRPPQPSTVEDPEYGRQYIIAGWRDPLADQATAVTLVLAAEQASRASRPEALR